MSYIDLITIALLGVYIQTEIVNRMVTSTLCAMSRVTRTLALMPFLFSTYPAIYHQYNLAPIFQVSSVSLVPFCIYNWRSVKMLVILLEYFKIHT